MALFRAKKNRKKKKIKLCYHKDICRWKRDIFSMKLKLQGESFEKNVLKKIILKKDLMNLIETNHQINMTFDHSV